MKSENEVAQFCPTRHDPMDCSLPGSSIYGIFQARVLEWGAIAFSASVFRFKFLLLVLESIFFSCNILFYLNMIEDDNLIGTLCEIEKHCETSQGIVLKADVCVD